MWLRSGVLDMVLGEDPQPLSILVQAHLLHWLLGGVSMIVQQASRGLVECIAYSWPSALMGCHLILT